MSEEKAAETDLDGRRWKNVCDYPNDQAYRNLISGTLLKIA